MSSLLNVHKPSTTGFLSAGLLLAAAVSTVSIARAVSDATNDPISPEGCWLEYHEAMDTCSEFENDPQTYRDCLKGCQLVLEACLGDATPPQPPPTRLQCNDHFRAWIRSCSIYQEQCKLDGKSSTECIKFDECKAGALMMLRNCLGLSAAPTLATSIVLENDPIVVHPSSPKIRLKFDIGQELPDGDVQISIDVCNANGELQEDPKIIAAIFGVKPGEFETDIQIPAESLDCSTAILYITLLDSNGQPTMSNAVLLIVGWYGGDFNHDGVVNNLDLLDAVIALGEGLITQQEYQAIEDAVVAAQSGN